MSTTNKEDARRKRVNHMAIEIILADGKHEGVTVDRGCWVKEIERGSAPVDWDT